MDNSPHSKKAMKPALPHEQCTLCGSLADREEAYHKGGQEEGNFCLPPASRDLVVIQDTTGPSSRLKQLKQCPQCETYYWFWTDYEFLIGGSEDEEFLIRLPPEQVKDYLVDSSEKNTSTPIAPQETPPKAPPKASPKAPPKASPKVILNNVQLQTLWQHFAPFGVARDQYGWENAWSSDVAIPQKAIEESRQKMLDAWTPLSEVLNELHIDSIPFCEIELPKRITGGRKRLERLLRWLEQNQHLQDPATL